MLVEKEVHIECFDPNNPVVVPYYDHGIYATFSGLFSDVVIEDIDLAQLLKPRASSTFLIKVIGESMRDSRIQPNDRLIIDKSLPYVVGKKIAYYLPDYDGWTVKELGKINGDFYLLPANKEFEPYKIKSHDTAWGMVTWILHAEYFQK